MSDTCRFLSAVALVFALVPAGEAWAQQAACPAGAVNAITGNYTASSTTADGDPTAVSARCERCVVVRVQTGDFAWEDAGKVCNIWSDVQAYDVMFKVGQCGLIVPSFETGGVFYGASVPIRAEIVRLRSCPY